MYTLPTLAPFDTVEIISPAARCSDLQLSQLKELLTKWQLKWIVDENMFGKDLLCANTDDYRFEALKKALLREESKAVICARGGYGSMKLIPQLAEMHPPKALKLFIGMSDITALHLFFFQYWQWPTLHGALAIDKFSPECIDMQRAVLFGEKKEIKFLGVPMNELAKEQKIVLAPFIGGNLTLIQTSLGTLWEIKSDKKIILLEDTGERGYRIDRMFEHLKQAGIFQDAAAIVLGDFIKGQEPDGSCIVTPVLKRLAESINVPVVQVKGIGHDYINYPVPLGTLATLQLGPAIELTCHFRSLMRGFLKNIETLIERDKGRT